MIHFTGKVYLFCLLLLLTACGSISKGITEALLEKQDSEDTRLCEITGERFLGLQPDLMTPGRKMKVLMVHGVGIHLPGYSTQFLEKLTTALDLPVSSKNDKNITLADSKFPGKHLGHLRIKRFLNKAKDHELLFYELSWSDITAEDKDVLSYDNSGAQSYRRAEFNNLLKKFSNDTSPDPIIYLGEKRGHILTAFSQSFCWMVTRDWEGLPDESREICSTQEFSPHLNDSYALVSHSLGSRITIDGLQLIATTLAGNHTESENQGLATAMKSREISIYMMSNQLPMLQLGRSMPDISNQHSAYCQPEGEKYAERILSKTNIIAFSDPNDLLSYSLPYDFVQKYLDSRLCINATNVNINVAKVYDAFGIGKLANPLNAHIDYLTDDRVIALIAKGLDNENAAPIVNERCKWLETID
jgi:hypothetical protein